jgi:hypothetical protein
MEETNNMNKAVSAKPRAVARKKSYEAPAFRHERVFEVSALSCGKINATQGACRVNRKAS